jgi:regulator of protease activity HflC (stomatin/prohibitin superfamily)
MNIQPPYEIKQAMEFQIKEERDRRATVTVADGTRESKVIESYGQAARVRKRSGALTCG